jgi:hypothetical protein
MKHRSLGLLLSIGCASLIPPAFAHQVEVDFNDMFLGNTRTTDNTGSPNYGNINSGSGFLVGKNGEYNNDTGVVLFEKGDLSVPSGITGFISDQKTPSDPGAMFAPSGVVFGSSVGTEITRFQERQFASAMTGDTIWFSYLFRLEGPRAQGQVMFNVAPSDNSDPNHESVSAAFGITMGSHSAPGGISINANFRQNAGNLYTGGNSSIVYFDNVGSTIDHNGNGIVDGVDVGMGDISGVKSHLIIGRITNNATGDDTVDVWLDPANGGDPTGTPPTLTYTGNLLPSAGLTSIGFRGTRSTAPAPTGGPYTSGGHFALDHVRMSDNGNALAFVTGNVPVDPKLVIAPDSPSSSFNFRGVYGSGSPISSEPLTVKFRNDGANESITINSVALASSPANNPFTIVSAPPAGYTLAPGETAEVTVVASSGTFETNFTNSLIVSTDHPEQDKSINVAATFFSGGSRINRNPNFDLNVDSWISDNYVYNTPPVRVTPGFIGSAAMVRMKGVGDPNTTTNTAPDNLSQTVLNGAKDWEFTFFFSPRDSSVFSSYAGRDPEPTDRTFQVVIQSDNLSPSPATGTEGKFTNQTNGDAAMINLAYLPSGGGLAAFNGSNWVPLGLPALEGSIDTDNNGSLNPTGANSDTVNYYLVRVKGTGFGTSLAKYSVSVSQPNSTLTQASASDLSIWSNTSGQSHTPGAYTFTTGDVSDSGGESVLTTSYWIDEVSFFAVEARDPDFSLSALDMVLSHNGTTNSGSVTVTNTGFNNDLEISGISFNIPHVISTSQTLPLLVPAGTSVRIPVTVNPGGFTTTNNAARANITVTANVPLHPTRTVGFTVSATTTSNLVGNWNFEVLGNDPDTDWDSFAIWSETGTANHSKNVPGLVSGSTTAAYLGRNAIISSPFGAPTPEFVLEYDFAFKDSGDVTRSFFMQLSGANVSLPLLYRAGGVGSWSVAEGEGDEEIIPSVFLNPSIDVNGNWSLDDENDVKNVYKMRITGNAWNTTSPKYTIEILDSNGNTIASSPQLERFAPTNPEGVTSILFQSADVDGSGLWVDNVRAAAIVESAVRVVNFSKTADGFNISWDNSGNPIILERSNTLLEGSWVQLPLNSTHFSAGSFSDTSAPADKAFYRIRKP